MIFAKYTSFLVAFSIFLCNILAAAPGKPSSTNDSSEHSRKKGLISIRTERRYRGYILHFYYDKGQKRGKTTCTPKEKQSLKQLKLLDPVLFSACHHSELDHVAECEVGTAGSLPKCNEWRSICMEKLEGNIGYDDCIYLD